MKLLLKNNSPLFFLCLSLFAVAAAAEQSVRAQEDGQWALSATRAAAMVELRDNLARFGREGAATLVRFGTEPAGLEASGAARLSAAAAAEPGSPGDRSMAAGHLP